MKKIIFPDGGEFHIPTGKLTSYAEGYILSDQVRIEDLDDQPDPSNLAEIDYVIEGDKVRIVKLRNFMSYYDIKEQYGENIANEYWDIEPNMGKAETGGILIYDSILKKHYLQKGLEIKKNDFDKAIKVMKKAGNRLHDLIKQSKKTRTVKI